MYARTCLSKSASNTTDLHTIKHVLRHHSLDINQPVHTFSLLPSKTMPEELCLMAVAWAITIVKRKNWKNKNRRKKWSFKTGTITSWKPTGRVKTYPITSKIRNLYSSV
jgi:hypothetical protein